MSKLSSGKHESYARTGRRRGFVMEPATSFSEQLQRVILERRLDIDYQALWDVAMGRCVGAEALVRWGEIPPEIFIRFAKRDNLIDPIGRQMLLGSLSQVHRWKAKKFDVPDFQRKQCAIDQRRDRSSQFARKRRPSIRRERFCRNASAADAKAKIEGDVVR